MGVLQKPVTGAQKVLQNVSVSAKGSVNHVPFLEILTWLINC